MNENLKQMQERINARQSLIDAREDQIADLVIKNETPKLAKPTKEEALQLKDKVQDDDASSAKTEPKGVRDPTPELG